MRRKLFLCLTAMLLLSACVLAYSFSDTRSQRTHQHLVAEKTETCAHGEDVFCTHLPLIAINTGGQTIPGEARDGSVITVAVRAWDASGLNHHLSDTPTLEEKAEIRYRGNSSMSFEKKNFLVKVVDEGGEEKKVRLFGMGLHDEWNLHGPFLDKSLMRNYMWYNIGGEIMDWAPNTRFCELFVDGEYRGVYVALESIDRGEESRVKITQYKEGDPFTSYIIRLDRGVDGDGHTQFELLDNFTHYARRTESLLDIKYPGGSRLNEENNRYITEDFSKFEKALYSYDYDDRRLGYEAYIDVNSFVDYFIINEFSQNYDAGNLSTYLYKDIKGKLNMALWDFNSACDNYQQSTLTLQKFEFPYNLWFYMLVKDEDYVEAVIKRYRELRRSYLSEEYLFRYIDETEAYLGDAVNRNYEVWGYTFEDEEGFLRPRERNIDSYEEALEQMKIFIRLRGDWMDENIEILRQYCHESKVKKFNH